MRNLNPTSSESMIKLKKFEFFFLDFVGVGGHLSDLFLILKIIPFSGISDDSSVTVLSEPQPISYFDDSKNIKQVACGTNHTLVLMGK